MTGTFSLRTLVRLKQQRVAALGDDLTRCQRQLRERVHDLDLALTQESSCRADEQAQHDKLFNTGSSGQGFRGSDIVTLQYLLGDAEKRTAEAGKKVRQAEQQVEAAHGQARAAQGALQRGEQQLEQHRQGLQRALDAIERAQEDQQDEESEETAVARLLAGARALAADAPTAGA